MVLWIKKKTNSALLIYLCLAFCLAGCSRSSNEDVETSEGVLRAVTGYDANSYFIYRGQPMGFEYELLSRLAKHLDLKLDIVTKKDKDAIFDSLGRGEADILAANLTITKSRARKYNFTEYIFTTRQVLVQRKSDQMIKGPLDLIGKKVHVRRNSSYYTRLIHLSEEIGGEINIEIVPGDISTDELISRVTKKEIDYTVADENIALINKGYHPNLNVSVAISFPQRIAWVVRDGGADLLEKTDAWIRNFRGTLDYGLIYSKYYKNTRAFRKRRESEFFSYQGNKISPYDAILKEKAKEIDWDWRLLAALVYQESLFNPKERSWAGAVGLMQLMPKTAANLGVNDLTDPRENVSAGVRHLKWLKGYWKEIRDPEQRLKFVMASYNAGQGHVEDARRLAETFGKDPQVWDGQVDEFILKLAEKKYYNHDVVQYGYCRGREPYLYVKAILKWYEHYQKLIE